MDVKSIKEKLQWILRRHPLLYYTRFALISENHKGDPSSLPAFNDINKKEDVHPLFFEANKQIAIQPEMDAFEKAKAITAFLQERHVYRGTGLGFSSDKTLGIILEREGGVCSDHSQVFNIFCLINDISVREWGIVDKFYNPSYGHTFNEIYSAKLNKWIVIDVWMGVYFTSPEGGPPFSAIELFRYLRKGNGLHFIRFFENDTDISRVSKIYSKEALPFLITNYNNKVYDHYLNKYQDRFSAFAINALLIFRGKNYKFLFVIDNYKTGLLPFMKKHD